MAFLTTGKVARALGITEPQLSEHVRRGRVKPAPEVASGRRIWTMPAIRQVAQYLNLDWDGVAKRLAE